MRPEYFILLAGYFLGAIPFGYILTRFVARTDIRTVGSGNIGATNVFRNNRFAGIATLLLDAGKGYLAVLVAGWLGGGRDWQAAAGVAAILGHMFTVFLRFRGGKGVATGCGAYLAISPLAVCTTLGVFLVTMLLTRYVSLASIIATAAYPFWAYWYHESLPVLFWATMGSAFIIAKHHQNIRRLISGTEHKFAFGGRSG